MDSLENKAKEQETQANEQEQIKETGQLTVDTGKHKVLVLSIVGEIEGHEALSNSVKTTKYEHIIPTLAKAEEDTELEGILILLNTVGGDVESGLAIAEMITSQSKPTVSLVLGGSHSIGVPLAVSTDYSFIVPTGTMLIHPVRLTGMVIGAPQTYDYFQRIQDRIVGFISRHSNVDGKVIEDMMLNTGMLTKDLGTILVGAQAVEQGLINEVGGIKEAFAKLYELIETGQKKA